jgi:hypothetical protein
MRSIAARVQRLVQGQQLHETIEQTIAVGCLERPSVQPAPLYLVCLQIRMLRVLEALYKGTRLGVVWQRCEPSIPRQNDYKAPSPG